tara:strand:- start:406 stop:720 length:315 start_codon:yes stop_codon:yes gene_type:complete
MAWVFVHCRERLLKESVRKRQGSRQFSMSLETLDLHKVKHQDAEEQIARFLNWVDVPCRIITGNSNKMKEITKKMVDKYGYHCYNESTFNQGCLIVIEGNYKGF